MFFNQTEKMFVLYQLEALKNEKIKKQLGASFEFFQICAGNHFPKLQLQNEDGTISYEQLIYLKKRNIEKTGLYKFILENHYKQFLILSIVSLIISLLIFPSDKFAITIIYGFPIVVLLASHKVITAKKLTEEGVQDFNNKKTEEALQKFKKVQQYFPQYAKELDNWIFLCLYELNRIDEAIKFLETKNVEGKRAKIFFILTEEKKYEEALSYFNNSFTETEINQAPQILLFPTSIYTEILKQPQKAIKYLESKNIIDKNINELTYPLFAKLADLYLGNNDKYKLKEIYIKMNKFKPDDIVVAERLKKLIQEETL